MREYGEHKQRNTSQDTIRYYLDLQSTLETERSTWSSYWEDVSRYLLPNAGGFSSTTPPTKTDGSRNDEYIVDDTATLALNKFASSVISMTMPAGQKYHRLSIPDHKVSDSKEIVEYLDKFNDSLFFHRYRPSAGFMHTVSKIFLELGAFGNAVLFTQANKDANALCYKAIPIAQCYFTEDNYSKINILHRKYQMTVFQIVEMFGEENISGKVKALYDAKKLLEKISILHCVHPTSLEYNPESLGIDRFKYSSVYIEYDTRNILYESGFNSFPFSIIRDTTFAQETYGRGRGMDLLRTIKSANRMKLTLMRAGELSAAPMLIASDSAPDKAYSYMPGAVNFGYMNDRGEELIRPIVLPTQPALTENLLNTEREIINDGFFVNLFRVLVDAPVATATEVMQRAQEKGQLLEPILGRVQSDLLGPMIRREIELLQEMDRGTYTLIPEPTPAVVDYFVEQTRKGHDAAEFVIEYSSPLNLARDAGVASSMLQTFQAITPLMQVQPDIAKKFDFVKAAEFIARSSGMPEDVLLSEEEVQAKEQEQVSQQQAQQLLQAVPALAGSAKDFAQAQALTGSGASVAPNLFPEM